MWPPVQIRWVAIRTPLHFVLSGDPIVHVPTREQYTVSYTTMVGSLDSHPKMRLTLSTARERQDAMAFDIWQVLLCFGASAHESTLRARARAHTHTQRERERERERRERSVRNAARRAFACVHTLTMPASSPQHERSSNEDATFIRSLKTRVAVRHFVYPRLG